MQGQAERILIGGASAPAIVASLQSGVQRRRASAALARTWFLRECDTPARGATVVLHLRARYVSKAAILTVPARHLLVENRSPA